MSGILSFISGLFGPVSKLVEKIPTEQGKMELTNQLAKIQSDVQLKLIEYDTKVLQLTSELAKSSASLAIAEAGSESWFVRHYKPVIVFGLFILICLDAFGLTAFRLPEVFITVFSSAFGILSVSPVIGKVGTAVSDKLFSKKE